ncbi:MAG: SLBB domain-containing protein [Deltaproteobacteria bacterium]|nr:SLBB domain-containing protein [Deltaproteobacteria bacterium]
MKRNFVVALIVSIFLTWGFRPILAQQISPPWPSMQQAPGAMGLGPISPPQFGQPPGPPFLGSPTQGGPQFLPQTAPQFQYPQAFQGPPINMSQFNQRYCSWVTVNQMPSLKPSLESQAGPQITPIQGPWPGALDPSRPEELRAFQPSKSQVGARQPPVGQGQLQPGLNVMGSLSPGQIPNQLNIPGFPAAQPFFIEPFSTVEAAFQAPIFPDEKPRELRQYGYSLFASPVSTFAPVEDVPVGPDYILGPGDDLAINIWGAMEGAIVRTIDRNGQIILPSAGPVRVWGLSFSQADHLIREQLSRYYRGFQTSVSMGRLRTIRIYVVGEVCQPGSFTLSSLSTVTNGLFAAGGPLKLGSLRKIELKRDHHTVGTLDVYDFLLRGDKTRDFRLQSGDTIFVPPVGPIAAITGEVKRPAIYEFQGRIRVMELVDMAGGLTPQSYLKRVQIIRTKPNAEREVIDLDLTAVGNNGDSPANIELKDGDLVTIYPTDPRIYNSVTLAGAVKHPGQYEVKPGMRLAQILRPEGVLPEAFVDWVEVARLKEDLTTEVIQVNLKQAWAGDETQNTSLRPLDRITVRSEYRSPWKVAIEGEAKRPGVYTIQQGERLSSVLKRTGGFTEKAYLKGAVFTRATVRETEKTQLEAFTKDHEQRLLAEASQLTAIATGLSKEEAAIQQAVLVQRREQLRLLASKVTLGRVVVQLDELDKFEGSPNDIILEDGDTLAVPQKPQTVVVMGSVRNPTGIVYKEAMDIQYYLNRAGGLTREADEKGMYVLKADGSALTGFLRLRDIQPGDVVVVPPSTEAKLQWLPLLRDLATIAGQVAIGVAGLAAIF